MRASIRRGSWLLIVILLAGLGTGCDRTLVRPGSTPRPTPTPGPTFDPELTGFDGIVVDESGDPIAGVRIVLQLGQRRGTAGTTDEGTFFDRGHVGEIGITATLEGYETVETSVTVVPDEIAEVEIILVEE